LADTDGSEVLSRIEIYDLPADFTLALGGRDGGPWVIDRDDGQAQAEFLDGLRAGTHQIEIIPPADFSGPVTVQVHAISEENGEGDPDTERAVISVPLFFAPVNDAPVGTDNTITIDEDESYTFTAADFGFTDVDPGDALAAVRIDSLPVAGSLTLHGAVVEEGQVIDTVDIGGLAYTPAENDSGDGYASFTFSVRDSAGAFDPSPNTLTFDVTPANDAPVLVSGPVSATLTEDVSININYPSQLSAVGTLTYSDPDGPAPILLSDGWFNATFVSATAHGVGATVSDELLEALQLNGFGAH